MGKRHSEISPELEAALKSLKEEMRNSCYKNHNCATCKFNTILFENTTTCEWLKALKFKPET